MSLESRVAKLERASGGETVYAIQKLDPNDQPLDVVMLCRGGNEEMSRAQFERRYPTGVIIEFVYD